MIGRIEKRLRHLRRNLSRSVWLARLLRLPVSKGSPTRPGLADKPHLEPRGALWIAVDLHGKEVQIINTHLGLNRRERKTQVDALLSSDWMANEQCHEPVILCGDFNALPLSSTCRRLCSRFKDVQVEAQHHRPLRTYSGRVPTLRIDHIFISPGLEVTGIEVPRSELARLASDHLPLVATVRIQKTQGIPTRRLAR